MIKFNDQGIMIECGIPFKIDLIPKSNATSRPQNLMIPESITIHNTGNPDADAEDNSEFVDNTKAYTSWTFTIGDNIILQELPINENGWHAGDGTDGKGNRTSIGIEISEKEGDKAYITAIKFIAELLVYFDWKVDKNMFPHQHWSGKYCPRLILKKWISDFVPRIEDEMERIIGEGNMEGRIDLKFISDGNIIKNLEKSTIDLLNGRIDAHRVYVEDTIEVKYVYCGRDLKYGDWKTSDYEDVSLLQEALLEGGIDIGIPDGMYGNDTKNGVVEFCNQSGLNTGGIATEEVAIKLNERLVNQDTSQTPIYEKSINGLNLPKKILEYGNKGNDVRNLQLIFTMIGEEPSIDGSFGNECKSIINRYKNRHNLPEDGKYDIAVYNLLGKEVLSKKTIYYKSGGVFYAEAHKDNIHGRKEMVNGYKFDDMINSDECYLNATFRWYNSSDSKTYAQTAFVADGIVHENRCAENYNADSGWLGDPMPHFIVRKNGEVYSEVLNNIKARKDTDFAIAGIQMYPSVNYVGFKASNINSLAYSTNRLAVAYNPVTGRVMFAYSAYMHINQFAEEINEKGYVHTTGIDSGGSAQCDLNIIKRNSTRIMACWVVFDR